MSVFEVTFFLLAFVLILLVACRARRAIRAIWKTIEDLRAALVSSQWETARHFCDLWGVVAPNIPPEKPIIEFKSQAGEDFQAWQLLNFARTGFFVDVGAFDGVTLSNTYVFEKLGWKGILVEASTAAVELCRVNRPNSQVCHAAVGSSSASGQIDFSIVKGDPGTEMLSHITVGSIDREQSQNVRTETVPHRSLDSILEATDSKPDVIDLMRIDVEGTEMDVLNGLALERWRPRILIIESNDSSILEYLLGHGYQLSMTVGCNWIFSRNTDSVKLPLKSS